MSGTNQGRGGRHATHKRSFPDVCRAIRAEATKGVGPASIAVRTGVDYRFVLAALRLRVEEVSGELVDAGMGES